MLYDVVIDKKVVDRNVVLMWIEAFPEAEIIGILDNGKRHWVSQQKLGF